ncbi:MAG: hypothetical protein GQ564_09925 [Bacteroidales bacterium]|nr:hypothetical protein [Bacteroidales bacterium]
MSKRKLTYKEFKEYFSNNLPNKDKHTFEKDMMQDSFEEDAFEGLSKLGNDELEQDIIDIKSRINKNRIKTHSLLPIWYKYAASVVILIGIGFSIFFLNSRFWQDSMLKEQISEEMGIIDSMILETDVEIDKIAQSKKDTSQDLPEDLIADNRMLETKEETVIINDDVEDELISDETKVENDQVLSLDNELEIAELDENDEVFNETEAAETKIEVLSNEDQMSQEFQEQISSVNVEKSSQSKKRSIESAPVTTEKISSRVITGKIIGAEDNLSIPGVSIALEDNRNIGTTTNIEGEFSLTIPNDEEELKTLIASFVGLKEQEINIEDDSNILVYMEPDVLEMDEVVVTAIGIKRDKKALGYSAKSVEDTDKNEKTEAKPSNTKNKTKFIKYVIDKLDYSKLNNFTGNHTIEFSFTVETSGELSNFNFTLSPDTIFDNEIIRVMKDTGYWIPATENNQNVNSTVKLTLEIDVQKQ